MRQEEFATIVAQQLEKCESLLCSKGQEYDFGGDRFHSFKVAAALEGVNTKQALLGYLTKHVISLYDMITSGEDFELSRWEEKITDTMNYLLLLKGMVIEGKQDQIQNTAHPKVSIRDEKN